MNLSFIKANKKSLISTIAYSWLLCFIASILALGAAYILIDFQTQKYIQYSKNFDEKIKTQQALQNTLTQQSDFLDIQLTKLQDIEKEGTGFISAINNLFGLIPEQITINSLSLTATNLTIKGITPSKELYVFLLETPLKAIFSTSRVDFFLLPSGWYNFTSVSTLNPSTTSSSKANNDR